jgi:hypothetical protein
LTTDELEAHRRTAVVLRYRLERDPQYARIREAVLSAGPTMVRNAAGGSVTREQFDVWMMHNQLSGVITAAEAAQWRREAGMQ